MDQADRTGIVCPGRRADIVRARFINAAGPVLADQAGTVLIQHLAILAHKLEVNVAGEHPGRRSIGTLYQAFKTRQILVEGNGRAF